MRNSPTYLFLENHSMWVRFRKKYILPIRWFFTKNRHEAELEMRSKQEILNEKDRLEKEHMQMLRLRRVTEAQNIKGKLEFIDWVLCPNQAD